MKKIHMIANAHLDPVWLWRWQEGCAEALSTFRTAAEMTDQFEGFVFNHNESVLYEWVKENDPSLFQTIQEKVKRGQWHIMGGWYIQPDCNMPSGESFVRNIETGLRFFRENFGVRPTTAINFDSFGHSRGLVHILRKAGYDSYLVCRPHKQYFDFPQQDFLFEGLDGSEILVHRSDENYNSVWGHVAEELKAFLEDTKEEKVSLYLWGVGDHGGGPSKKDLADLTDLQREGCGCLLLHSSPEAYFEELRETQPQLPVVRHALNPVSPGCYTSQIRVKQKHRELENELYSAEKMAVAAHLACGAPYPKERFEEAQRDLLFSEFHDALPGSATHEVEEDTLRLLDHGLELMSREKMKSFLALSAGEPRVIDGTTPLLFYNPHPFAVEGVFRCEMGIPKQNWTTDFMYPEAKLQGETVPTQAIMETSHFSLDWRKKVAVQVKLPPFAMTRLDVYWKPIKARPKFEEIVSKPLYTFSNGELEVEIDTATGLLRRCLRKGKVILKENSFQLACFDDTYSPWALKSKTSSGKRTFQLLSPHAGSAFSGIEDRVIPSVRVIEDGQVETVVESVFGLGDSKAYLRYILPKQGSYFDVEVLVQFSEKQQYLKLLLNTPFENGTYLGQVPFGRDSLLSDGTEEVSQKWCGLSSGEEGIAVINGGTYGSSCEKGQIALTLLRSAGYTASDFVMGKAYSEDRFAERMEQGERRFRFRVSGLEAIDNQALVFQEAPYALAYCPSGKGEKPGSFMTVDDPEVVVSALKAAEDGDGYILRLYESTGTHRNPRVQIPLLEIDEKVEIPRNSVETFRVRKGRLEKAPLIEE